ncbi:TPA: hypothetical protein MJA78_25685 [Klebsiella pneumoniae]|nr:hypothetical protein [Klebsiella pneumoniae]
MEGAAGSCLIHARKRPSGPLTRRYAPTAAKPCRDHSDGVQRRLRCFKRLWLCSYRVKFPDIAEITEEHPPKRQQQAP